jgi:hypothetical protein
MSFVQSIRDLFNGLPLDTQMEVFLFFDDCQVKQLSTKFGLKIHEDNSPLWRLFSTKIYRNEKTEKQKYYMLKTQRDNDFYIKYDMPEGLTLLSVPFLKKDPILLAARYGSVKVLRFLSTIEDPKVKRYITFRDEHLSTALEYCQETSSMETVDLLVELGAPITIDVLHTFFSYTQEIYPFDGLKKFLDKFLATGKKIDELDDSNKTLVAYALEGNRLDLVDYFISVGADIHFEPDDYTYMFCAFTPETIQYLLDKGLDINHVAARFEDSTPLMEAVSNFDKDCIEALISKGALIDYQVFGETALMLATMWQYSDMVDLLLQYKDSMDLNLVNSDGKTAIMLITDKKTFDVYKKHGLLPADAEYTGRKLPTLSQKIDADEESEEAADSDDDDSDDDDSYDSDSDSDD